MFSLRLSEPSMRFLSHSKSRGNEWVSQNARDEEELQFWISSGQKPQPITCFCAPDQRGSAALNLWRNTDPRSSLVSRSSSLSLSPQHCCLLEEPDQHLVSVPECPKEAPRTRLVLNMRDIFTLITRNVNLATQQHTTTMNRPNRFIIVCDDDMPSQLFSNIFYTQHCRTFIGNTDFHISDNNNVSSDLKNSTTHSPPDPNNNSEVHQSEVAVRDNFNNTRARKSLCSQNYNHPGETSGRARNVKMRKSVSFDDDVTVYLFDQESPTMELHSDPCTSLPSSSSCNLLDVTSEDSGLEWEDDFSALEKNCHFQCVSHCRDYTLSLPTQSWTAPSRPERYCLPQTCLFLTHVTESDLEL